MKARVHELVMVAGRVEASAGCPNHLTVGATERCPKCRARLEGAMEWLNRLDVERGPRWAEREVYG